MVLPPRPAPAPAASGRSPAFAVGVFFVVAATAALLLAWSLAMGGAHDSSAVGYLASAVLWFVAGAFLHVGMRTPRAPSP